MNQSFLSGVEGLLTAVKDGNADSYIQQYGNTVSSIPLPNTLAAITRATRDYKVDVKDDKVMTRLENVIKNKLGLIGAADDLPLKRDLWGRPQRETPKGSNPLVYQLLDVTKNQEITDDPVSLELYRLWRKTGSSEMIPSLPGRTITQGRVTYALNADQRSRLAELVGARRREIVDGLVVDPNYHALNDEQKVALLKRAYDFGQRQGGGQFLLENQGKLSIKPKPAGF